MGYTHITVDGDLVGETVTDPYTGETATDPSAYCDATRVVVERDTGEANDGTYARATVSCNECAQTFADQNSATETTCPGNDDLPHKVEAIPLAWLNTASIVLDERDDAVHATISAGDPRGSFQFTIRRLPDGRMVMYLPHLDQSAPHMFMRPLDGSGAFEISTERFSVPESAKLSFGIMDGDERHTVVYSDDEFTCVTCGATGLADGHTIDANGAQHWHAVL